jgi:hypothetical protein
MITRVCSGFSRAGRTQYGNDFLKTFDRFWSAQVELQVYVEEPMPMPRGACRDLWAIPGAEVFHVEHRFNADAKGKVPHSNWKEAERRKGYSFRHDAYKFWKQILIPQAAAEGLEDGDILVWLDADVETFKRVPADFVAGLLGEFDVCYLGRARQHSEIGFWAVRINAKTRAFLALMADYYTSGAVFDLTEWHSAFVWDHVRKASDLVERNLCGPRAHGHVWPDTILSRYTIHHKGPRKGVIK